MAGTDSRPAHPTRRTAPFAAVLAALAAAGLFVHPHHPHFAAETLFGFWPLFGLLGGAALLALAGLALRPLTRWTPDGAQEDGHDR